MMTKHFQMIGLALFASLIGLRAEVWTFDADVSNKLPADFTQATTGQGAPGQWEVRRDDTAPSKPNMLVQTSDDATSYRFPLCILGNVVARDVELSVKFKTLGGAKDQAAGLVWRFQNASNYYVLRANALENNVVVYKMEHGKRTNLRIKGAGEKDYGMNVPVSGGQWHALKVVVEKARYVVHLDGQRLFEVEDSTFTAAGQLGLWTKADSVTAFDDFQVNVRR